MIDLFNNYMQGEKLNVTAAWSVYNPGLGSNFATQRNIIRDRYVITNTISLIAVLPSP